MANGVWSKQNKAKAHLLVASKVLEPMLEIKSLLPLLSVVKSGISYTCSLKYYIIGSTRI